MSTKRRSLNTLILNPMVDDSGSFSGVTSNDPLANQESKYQMLVTVLAAGASLRLGQPKQLVTLAGEPLVRRQCRIAGESQLGPVAVVLGCYANELAAVLAGLPASRLINHHWSEGLAASIRCAAQAALDLRVDGLLLLHVDQYRLTVADLQSLYAVWKEKAESVCVAQYGDDFGPPVIFPRHCFAKLLELNGDVGARRIIHSLPAHTVLRVNLHNAIHDLDEPSQLAALRNSGTQLTAIPFKK